MTEASYLERVASDEQSIASQLEALPPSYAILHDLKVPGSKGNIDHVVVGPGGAFLIVTRRYGDAIVYRDGQLWAGQNPVRGDLDLARVEAQLISQMLGSPVVPLVAFMDTVMPAAAPRAVDGVLVCSSDTVCRVITRASHTLLTSPQVADVVERGLPLLHSPGTVNRTVQTPSTSRTYSTWTIPKDAVPGEPPTLPHEIVTSSRSDGDRAEAKDRAVRREAKAQARGAKRAERAALAAERRSRRSEGRPEKDTSELAVVPAAAPPAAVQPAAPVPSPASAPATRAWRRTLKLVGVAILGLSVVAVAVGALGRFVWGTWVEGDDAAEVTVVPGDGAAEPGTSLVDPGAAPTTLPGAVPAPTTLPAALPAPTVPAPTAPATVAATAPPAAGVVAPAVPVPTYVPYCPAAGAGWALVPVWPGSHPAVTSYDVQLGQLDGSWLPHANLAGPAATGSDPAAVPGVILGQAPGAVWSVRYVAVLRDGARVDGVPVLVTAPRASC